MANPISLSVRKFTRRGAYSVHHQQSAPWKNFGADRIVAGNSANPIIGYDPDGAKWYYIGIKTTTSQSFMNFISRLSRMGGEESEVAGKKFVIGTWASDENKAYTQRTMTHEWHTDPGENALWPEGMKRHMTQTYVERDMALREFYNRFPSELKRDQLWPSGDYMWSPIMPAANTTDEFYTNGNNVVYEPYEPNGNAICGDLTFEEN